MSLIHRTACSLAPHARPFLPATAAATRRAIPSTLSSSSPCSGRRSFHLASTVGDTIRMTADAFSWVHVNAGIPWYVTIPLLAVGVNATFRFPLQLYTARVRSKRDQLLPLLMVWTRRHSKAGGPDLTPERVKRLRTAGSTEKSRRRIYKNWGVQRWKSMTPLLGMLPFITISEALRQKCGAPVGWISNSVGLGSPDSATSNLASASSLFDQSLVDGGCLWFADLSSMDPYYGLPLICSSILAWNIWGRMTIDHIRALLSIQPDPSNPITLGRLQKLLGRTMMLVPLFPVLFADLPSAIFLYWGFSFALTNVNDAILGRLIPKKPTRLLNGTVGIDKRPVNLPFVRGPKSPPS
ncbi:hypothetical protein FZEAL_5124 [Fusarium zealandicum]|uniref:Mitochondrial export translocase Oxa2 n=1 Tax=Fusarium zealandicum TaxID=1053134 RepID=A0A8H4UL08_9HYPO|nr:hypothetical protein FZEAL_5124 [Fusarium zealandicum]